MTTRVYLELGRRKVFAGAVDWPGWGRFGKSEEDTLEALLAYEPRYAAAVPMYAGQGRLHVVGSVPGTGTTDFGAPDARGPWDDEPLDAGEPTRLAEVLHACWRAFDDVVAAAPERLRKGPRGGGRDREQVVATSARLSAPTPA